MFRRVSKHVPYLLHRYLEKLGYLKLIHTGLIVTDNVIYRHSRSA